MLGIKRYQGYALDLWVGNEEDFFCALKIEAPFILLLDKINEKQTRHVSFLLKENDDHKNLLRSLKELIDEKKLSHIVKRISFITQSVSHHDKIWEDLSKIFPTS